MFCYCACVEWGGGGCDDTVLYICGNFIGCLLLNKHLENTTLQYGVDLCIYNYLRIVN